MNREGVDPDNLDYFLNICQQYDTIEIEGVMSHLY
jgi:alanine racemase